MTLYFRLAWRNLWRHRRRTLIVVAAMALGLGLMMFYDGLLDGFDQAIYGNAIKVLGGNIQVHAQGYRLNTSQTAFVPLPDDQAVIRAAQAIPQVETASRRISIGGLASSPEGAFAVNIIGIEPETELGANLSSQHVVAGRYLTADDGDVIFIGKGLADAMGIQTGDRITLSGQAAHAQMRKRTMTVIGIFDLDLPDFEKQNIYISLQEAQDLYGLSGQSTEVCIYLNRLGDEAKVITSLASALPGYEIDSYETSYPELKQTIGTKNRIMGIFSLIILLIAGIGILNLLLMAVYERTREIGLLGALGLKPRQISLLFILEGTMMGLVGTAAGVVVGLLINGVLMKVGLDFGAMSNAASYMALISGRIYPTLGVDKLPWRALTVAIVSALAAFYPAYEASRREPAEALHYV